VSGDGGRVAEVVWEEDGFGTGVGHVVKSGDNVVSVVGSFGLVFPTSSPGP